MFSASSLQEGVGNALQTKEIVFLTHAQARAACLGSKGLFYLYFVVFRHRQPFSVQRVHSIYTLLCGGTSNLTLVKWVILWASLRADAVDPLWRGILF